MSRLALDIEANEDRIKRIEDAITRVEMGRDLGPGGEHADAMSVAIDCMMAERVRLLSHVSKLKAVKATPVKDAIVRQRLSAVEWIDDALVAQALEGISLEWTGDELGSGDDLPGVPK